MLLILDLDETLIYATESRLDRQEDFSCSPYYVYKRPGLNEFLADIQRHFDVAVWTSSSEAYAKIVVSHIFPAHYPLAFVWSSARCIKRFNQQAYKFDFVKDLKKVKKRGYSLTQVLMVDDSPEKLSRNYGNHIYIRPFTGDSNDNELPLLVRFLYRLSSASNVRTIEKRGWREHLLAQE